MKPRWWRPFERWRWRVAVNAAARDRALVVAGFFVEVESDAAARWARAYEQRIRSERWDRRYTQHLMGRARAGDVIAREFLRRGCRTYPVPACPFGVDAA